MARKDVKGESDYHERSEMSITVYSLEIPVNMDLLKAPRFPYQKRLQQRTPQFGNKGSEMF